MSYLFSASEIGLLRSRASVPNLLKTLFNDIEHLPEPVTCTDPLHVLGLVFNAIRTYLPLMRLTALKSQFLCVTQSISLSNIHASSFAEEAEP
jgi:hypothetical protein